MWLMLQQNKPDDYIIATNETHTVREFAEKAFEKVGLDWQPQVKFNQLVEIMLKQDLDRWQRHERGETFPWYIQP